MAASLDAFMTFAGAQGLDYHAAVVTTDVTTSQGNIPGLFHPQDAASVADRIVHPAMADPLGTLRTNVVVGDDGSPWECGIDAAYLALSPPLSTHAQSNAGFLRQQADLSIVFVSDEQDQSATSGLGLPFEYQLAFFRSLKSAPGSGRFVASATVYIPYEGDGYLRMQQATGGALVQMWNLDAEALEDAFRAAWPQVLGRRASFSLAPGADPDSIVVRVTSGGVPRVVTNWTYDAATGLLTFGTASVPLPGATIEITYTLFCQP